MENHRKWWKVFLRTDTVLLLVAGLAGIMGAVLSTRYLGAKAAATEASLRSRFETRSVVVAAADLSAGESLDASRLAVRKMPREFMPDDAVPADQAGRLLGGRTAIPIRRGTPVVAAALKETADAPRLSSVLAGERRALTIAVDQVNSQAGNLVPGDWVDLLYSHSSDGDSVLVPLLQQVEVLAAGTAMVGQNDNAGTDSSFSTITLGLSAIDATRVVLAQQSGNLSVVLRGSADKSRIPADPRTSRELLRRSGNSRPTAVDTRVEVLVGGNGGLSPERSWLSIGQGSSTVARDPS